MCCREYVIVTAVVHRLPITATRTFISILLVVVSSDGGEYGRLSVHLVPTMQEVHSLFLLRSSSIIPSQLFTSLPQIGRVSLE